MLRETLTERGVPPGDSLMDDVVLLASELFDNAVLHAGTEFDVEAVVDDEQVFVGVRDRGVGPLELHLSEPRRRYGRAASHGRGLLMLERVADVWGTRHEADGSHQVWFVIRRRGDGSADPAQLAEQPLAPAPAARPPLGADWAESDRLRWLLRVPARAGGGLELTALIAELLRRLRDLMGVAGISVEADDGDGSGFRQLARDGVDPAEVAPDQVLEVPLPVSPPLRGALRLAGYRVGEDGSAPPALAEVAAQRIALAVESDWLRGAERRRQTWMTYLADTSELLGQSLDVGMTVAVIPHVAVPRLGQWCAVYLPVEGTQPRLAAVSHADERALPELRDALDPRTGTDVPDQLRSRILQLMHSGGAPAWFRLPTDGIALPMSSAGRPVGVLAVGRRGDRAHSPEDVTIIADIARRAALAIDNAQRAEQHSATSHALQQALLPRALPTTAGVEFAAAYLPGGVTEVGGDFYDVVPVATGGWLAAIGDVCGKGARAASRTSLVRDVLRVLFRDRLSLVSTISSLNEVMLEAADPGQFCTLAAATISRHPGIGPTKLGVDLVLAGHPQPVLLRATGGADLVGRHGTAIGLVDSIQLTRTAHTISPGDTLIFYTDGVTERRHGRDQFGPERLLDVAAGCAGMSAEGTVSAIRAAVEGFSPDDRSDDIALLAVRADPIGLR
jgi:serine phosphatase RsbU (regulator of sigma subunit)/anti-sigma regulatory factor (Ser/Thr protein kinase)